jgi:SAM-dependent methyltransferase
MSRHRRYFYNLYRYLFVMPWRIAAYCAAGKFRSALAHRPPLPHPIDTHYGIATSGTLFGDDLRSGSARADLYSTAYTGTQPSLLRKVLRLIPCLEEATFLDLGCGMGRALVVASEFPLREIVGIELSPKLAAIARRNAQIIRAHFPERAPIAVLEGDAARALLPEGTVIVYLYHPFFKKVMKKVVATIENTFLANTGKKIFVVYNNPFYGRLFDASPHFRRVYAANVAFEEDEIGTGSSSTDDEDTIAIWESAGGPMITPHPHADAKIVTTRSGWRARVVTS